MNKKINYEYFDIVKKMLFYLKEVVVCFTATIPVSEFTFYLFNCSKNAEVRNELDAKEIREQITWDRHFSKMESWTSQSISCYLRTGSPKLHYRVCALQ